MPASMPPQVSHGKYHARSGKIIWYVLTASPAGAFGENGTDNYASGNIMDIAPTSAYRIQMAVLKGAEQVNGSREEGRENGTVFAVLSVQCYQRYLRLMGDRYQT
ncbi:hypothetical protein B0H14DRAFT_2595485 [Mycena olivaceomarginata]|nr:hypothetical protein B0H14DRAFT_2595485 [Mycena olivaceomarginata]